MTVVWSGLALGALYALVAVGYNIVFVSSGTFNFANAQLIMLGTFVAYWGIDVLKWNVVLVIVLSAVIVAVAAGVEERIAIRPVRGTEPQLVTTVGVATLLNGVTVLIWGPHALQIPFFGSTTAKHVFGGQVLPVDLWLIGIAVVLTVALWLFSRKTLLGTALLAVSEDREAASLRGINIRAVALGAFCVSGAVAGALGPFIGSKEDAVASLGTQLALLGFVALAMGGFGSLPGGLIGGFAVGLIQALSGRYLGTQYENIMVFAVLLLVLLFKPGGLFGTVRERMV
ncbi:MAG TPA: branched-chain amino acid ABC transporter permease [Acidimicrobiales bacterium]|nr:branched-chain amino acid ABC transporter permease [Acidimicrobiales bacterium]